MALKKKNHKKTKTPRTPPSGGETPIEERDDNDDPEVRDEDEDNGEPDDPDEHPASLALDASPTPHGMPNHFAVVEKVFGSKNYDLTTKMGCGRFLEDVVWALHKTHPSWGHLEKMPGQNQWNGHAVDAPLWFEQGRSQAVDIITAGESTDAKIGWNPDVPRPEYDARWYKPKGPDGFVLPPHGTRLGASLFWLMSGYRHYRPQLEANLTYIKDVLKADYIRAFAVVGGDEFPSQMSMEAEEQRRGVSPLPESSASRRAALAALSILDGAVPYQGLALAGVQSDGRTNPWKEAGSFLSWPDYDKVFTEAHDLVKSKGLKVAWTLVGGRAQVSSHTQQLQLVDRIAGLLASRLDSVEFVEMWNEYNITGGDQQEIRGMASRMRSRLGHGILIALDTPAAAMEEPEHTYDPLPSEVSAFYGGSSADTITPQWCRSQPNPRHMGADAPARHYSHEPRGPGASAGGDTTNAIYLADDYMQAALLGYKGYLYHTKAGVWGGHCYGWPRENSHANIFEHDPGGDIAAALSPYQPGAP